MSRAELNRLSNELALLDMTTKLGGAWASGFGAAFSAGPAIEPLEFPEVPAPAQNVSLLRAAQLGKEGEAAVRGAYDIGDKATIVINGRTRVPDGLTKDVISEVKNVDYQSFTRQLRDYSDFAQQTGRSFNLFTRPSTRFSGTLQDAIDSGLINHLYIP